MLMVRNFEYFNGEKRNLNVNNNLGILLIYNCRILKFIMLFVMLVFDFSC